MASTWRAPEDELACPVCHEIYADPVLLSCSHSFCGRCVEQWWHDHPDRPCPVCKRCSAARKPPRNLALKNLSDSFRRRGDAGASDRPPKRQKTLSSFPVVDAALALKAELQRSLVQLRSQLEGGREFQSKNTVEHFERQALNLESAITDHFRAVRRWLDVEEEVRLAAVTEEKQRKGEIVKEKITHLGRSLSTLSKTIDAIEKELKADNVSFLNKYETTKERVKAGMTSLAGCDEWEAMDAFKHTGNLSFRVWEKMKDFIGYQPVLLDPATVCEPLVLSADMATLTRGPASEDLGEGPGEGPGDGLVTGCEVINSGIHCWDVEVGDSAGWTVGVMEGCGVSPPGSQPASQPVRLSWALELSQGKYGLVCFPSEKHTTVTFMRSPKKIRVKLDWSAGELSFSDPETRVHIHTFEHTFVHGVVPYVHTTDTHPLVMLPRRANVVVDHEYDDFNRPEIIDLELISV